MAPPPPDDGHTCGWQARAIALESELTEMQRKLEALEKRVYGRKSEKKRTGKMPPAVEPKPSTSAQVIRAEHRAAFEAAMQTEIESCKVAESQRTCPKCGNTELHSVGEGKSSTTYRNRCVKTRSRQREGPLQEWARCSTVNQFDALCCSAADGGTVMWPRGSSSSLGSSRARVAAQYLGESSR
jgi:hypothetical protein